VSSRSESYLNNTLKILQLVLEKGEKINYRKKMVGWGLNESFFDSKGIRESKNVSRTVFRKRKSLFLKSKLIMELPSKDKRKNNYAITPLGICYLFNHKLEVDKFLARRIFEITNLFESLHGKINLLSAIMINQQFFKNIFDNFPFEMVSKCLTQSLKNIKLEYLDKGTIISYYENLPNNFTINRINFSIIDSQVFKINDIKEPFSLKGAIKFDDLTFHHAIGTYIYRGFHNHLFSEIKDKEFPEFYVKEFPYSVDESYDIWIEELEQTKQEIKKELTLIEKKVWKT